MADTTTSRGPGRPKSLEKRESILKAAKTLFLERGFSETSMEMVAEAAGVGKPTVYSHFGAKADLLDAVATARRKAILERLPNFDSSSEDVRADLEQFALRLHEGVFSVESQLWIRLVVAEAGRHPEVAQKYYAAGPAHGLSHVKEYIEKQVAAGRLHVEDADLAADHFMGLVLGFNVLRALMASQPNRTKRDVRKHVQAAVGVFLARYAARQKED